MLQQNRSTEKFLIKKWNFLQNNGNYSLIEWKTKNIYLLWVFKVELSFSLKWTYFVMRLSQQLYLLYLSAAGQFLRLSNNYDGALFTFWCNRDVRQRPKYISPLESQGIMLEECNYPKVLYLLKCQYENF